jgi:hypothetical protein
MVLPHRFPLECGRSAVSLSAQKTIAMLILVHLWLFHLGHFGRVFIYNWFIIWYSIFILQNWVFFDSFFLCPREKLVISKAAKEGGVIAYGRIYLAGK